MLSRKTKRNRIDVTTYFMPPETKKVAVEYLLYDLIGVIGAVGGTMGLFIGFSMFGKYYFVLLKTFNEINLLHASKESFAKSKRSQFELYIFSRNGFKWIRIRWHITQTY